MPKWRAYRSKFNLMSIQDVLVHMYTVVFKARATNSSLTEDLKNVKHFANHYVGLKPHHSVSLILHYIRCCSVHMWAKLLSFWHSNLFKNMTFILQFCFLPSHPQLIYNFKKSTVECLAVENTVKVIIIIFFLDLQPTEA